MTRIVLLLAAILTLAGALPASAQEQNPSFNLVNHGASAIRELYVTPAGDARWGINRLPDITIAVGGSFAVRRRIDGNCLFDIRVVFADGRAEQRRGVNTCSVADVAVGEPVASATAPGPSKAADDPSFRLANRGTQPVDKLFATPAGLGNWGENRLGDAALAPGGQRMVLIPKQGTCLFDLRVVFADHTAKERHKTDLCRLTELPVP